MTHLENVESFWTEIEDLSLFYTSVLIITGLCIVVTVFWQQCTDLYNIIFISKTTGTAEDQSASNRTSISEENNKNEHVTSNSKDKDEISNTNEGKDSDEESLETYKEMLEFEFTPIEPEQDVKVSAEKETSFEKPNAGLIKSKVLKYEELISTIEAEMTPEQHQVEETTVKQQLTKILEVLKEQEEKFNVNNMEDLESQLSLYK